MREINNSQDILDSRDIIERIEELEETKEEFILNESETEDDSPSWAEIAESQSTAEEKWDETEDGQELKALLSLQDDLEGYCVDWEHGVTLIRDSYFVEYTKELLGDIGYIPSGFPSWIEIDWEGTADNVQMDYTSGDYDGVTYWAR